MTHRSVRGRVAKRAPAASVERRRRLFIVDGAVRLEEAGVVLPLVGAGGMRANTSGEREQAARDEHEHDKGRCTHGCRPRVEAARGC